MSKHEQHAEPSTIGRPRKEITASEVRKLRAMGCTEAEVAAFFDCSKRTLIRRLQDTEELRIAWNDGAELGKISLRQLQFRHARGTGAAAVAMTIHLSKQHLGETDKTALELSTKDDQPIQHQHSHAHVIAAIDLSKLSTVELAQLYREKIAAAGRDPAQPAITAH